MVFKFFPNLKFQKGITLIEIIVVICIIAVFSLILIADFPRIQRGFALSQTAYQLAQDTRRAQDMGLSGVQVKDKNGDVISVKGYGIYINASVSPTVQYLIYADVNGDQKYDDPTVNCADVDQKMNGTLTSDCIVETENVTAQNPNLYIERIDGLNGDNYTSINFSPPNPIVNIDNIGLGGTEIGIVLGLSSDSSALRTIKVNTSGLINVQ